MTRPGAAIGLDVGTSSVKGLAIDPAGAVLATREARLDLSTPRPGWAEQDPAAWWEAAESVLAGLREEVGELLGIGLSGQMHGLVALDRAGAVIRPAILWNDQRSAPQGEQIEHRLGRERLIELTGNRAVAGFTAPKLLWLREHEPESYRRLARIMLPKDYVRLRLCGEWATDVADASGTLLFDVGQRSWSEAVLDALELDRAWMPPALEGPTVSGETPDGVAVAAGAGDQAAGAVGVGAVRRGPASIVLGSSGVVFSALDGYRHDDDGRAHAFCHAIPGRWHAMGVMLTAAGALAWFHGVVAGVVAGGGAGGARAGGAADEAPLNGAEGWGPGVDGLTFLPYLAGERTPHADPRARGAFCGLELRHDTGALARAVLEGVAFGMRDSLDLLEALNAGVTVGRVSGGGARSRLWLSILASVLELPLERLAVEEGAAYGAALLGGVAGGVWPDVDAAVAATVAPRETIDPVAEWIEPYRRARERYRALYPALRAAEER
jgi:xylulokinase